MAGSLSDACEDLVLDHLLSLTAWTMPTRIDIGLYTTACTDASPGTEVTGGSYARKQTADADWTSTAGVASNAQIITFVTPTGSWGTVTHFALFDQAGTYLAWSDLTTPQAIGTGNTVSFAVGDLDITLT